MLIRGVGVSRALSSVAANGLIGRFLYAYFLADRGIIDQQWVTARGHVAIDLAAQNVDWANGLSRPRVKPGVLPHVN